MWEYKFFVLSLDIAITGEKDADPLHQAASDLNAEGEVGWEVVAVLPKMGKGDSWTIALLKRPRRHIRERRDGPE
jgi:hypothetical protein